jgi:hypothetical protein
MKKLLIFLNLAGLITLGSSLYAYTFNVTNKTPQTITVQLGMIGGKLMPPFSLRSAERQSIYYGGWDIGLCVQQVLVNNTNAKPNVAPGVPGCGIRTLVIGQNDDGSYTVYADW